MLVVGLTGGIASGKTAVSNAFAKLGVPIVDTDLLARQVVEPNQPGLLAIRQHFGNAVLDQQGRLNRAALRAHIFEDETARQQLNALLHPLIETLARQHLDILPTKTLYALLVVPLLFESGMERLCDQVLVVDVPESVQIQRLCQRDDLDSSLAVRILATQSTRQDRLARADQRLDNSGDRATLLQQVTCLNQYYRKQAQQRAECER